MKINIQSKRIVEINCSVLKLVTMRRCLSGSGVLFIIFFASIANADIYIDSQQSIQDNTDALVSVLNKSVVPGGVRSVKINGNDLKVKRFANPAGDSSEFYEVWTQAAERKKIANNEILSVLNEYDPVYAAFTKDIPKSSLKNNVNKLLNIGDAFADSQSEKLKNKVVDAIETPFTYETQQHRVIASVPIKTIKSDSPLSRNKSSNGYLFMAEKQPGTTISNGFWQMEFGDNFKFADLFGRNDEDVNGEDSNITRYPNSKMTMTYSESANGWDSQSWSYESNGDVISHITHYIDAFKAAGYRKDSHSVVQSDYGLVQFANRSKEATLFVELTDPLSQSVLVTLQIRSN